MVSAFSNENSILEHFYLYPPETEEEIVNKIHKELLEKEWETLWEIHEKQQHEKFYKSTHDKLENIPKNVIENDAKKTLNRVKGPAGIGKTTSITKGSIEEGRFIGVFERHGVAEEFSSKFELRHLKGFTYTHKPHFDDDGNLIPPECEEIDFSATESYRFPLSLLKAEHRKKMKSKGKDCPYFTQYENIEKSDNLAMVHEHMKTKQFKELVNDGKKPAIVNIDETPLSSFTDEINITIDDLKKLENALQEMIILYDIIVREEYDPKGPNVPFISFKVTERIIVFVRALRSTLEDMDERHGGGIKSGKINLPNSSYITTSLNEKIPEYLAKNFEINERYKKLNGYPTKGNNIESILGIINTKNQKGKRVWEYPYYKLIKHYYRNVPKEGWFRNILEEVIKIAEYSAKYLDNNNVNLPFTPIYETRDGGFVRKCLKWKHIDFEQLKDCFDLDAFVIITDATTTSDMYRLLAEKIDFEYRDLTHLLDIPEYNRNIFQTTDGMYYIESFENAFDKMVNLTVKIIKFHITEGFVNNKHKANIICLYRFENRVKEELIKRGIDPNCFRVNHYWNLRGINYMKDDYLIILLGIPEPNILETWMEAKTWHISEKTIGIDRREEPRKGRYNKGDYYYLDERLRIFVEMKRENELEQIIERLRFFLGDANKFAYMLTALPISYKTEKLTCKEIGCMIDVMNELRSDKLTITELNNRMEVDYRILKAVVGYLKGIKWVYGFPKDKGRSHSTVLVRANKLLRIG
jgi:hypothetical protein